ncbi:CBS domain-containing protein CBSCBSPB5-like [Zingiber officinale]|uniref:CBS domain-containing protein CBSCBSPB5-like n=1 Tax=Zingiber officinale TaxID=94328 RepID=UPI001C4D8F2A|nr:CBS domain-containing protein CBSCBSPB5-like [Zingiber officinale]
MEALARSRRSSSLGSSPARKRQPEMASPDYIRKGSVSRSLSTSSPSTLSSERTVKRLRLSKALTMPDSTTVLEACRRMAAQRVDAVLLTDSNALLCGILTDRDVAMRVVACELSPQDTPVSKAMTRNPIFVLSDTLAEEALQKMVLGKFRHLPVVENGEVIALLDITKCLYNAIARVERIAEKGKAIQLAVEGVEKNWGTSISGANSFLEALRQRVYQPSLATVIPSNSYPKVVTVSPAESVLAATKKMLEYHSSSAIITSGNKLLGILTSRDILMRVVAKNLQPDTTSVERAMTPNPDCRTIDASILDALQTLRAGKFLHLPLTDKSGKIVSVLDVLHITHAALATFESNGGVGNEAMSSLMQKFWDSALTTGSLEEDDETRSEGSVKMASEGTETVTYSFPSSNLPDTFSFKLQDKGGRIHRFHCETRSLAYLITSILQRVGGVIDRNQLPQILYEDEDGDKVVLACDGDLIAAVDHARVAGWKGLRLYLDYTGSHGWKDGLSTDMASIDSWITAYNMAAAVALIAGLGVMVYVKRFS